LRIVEEEENEKSRRRGEFQDRGSKEGKKREKKGEKINIPCSGSLADEGKGE